MGPRRSLRLLLLLFRVSRHGAQLCILEPKWLRSKYPDGCLWGSTATYAAPSHADRTRGHARWVDDYGCDDGREQKQWWVPIVQLVRRGYCSFAQKARTARRSGARALVVVDDIGSQVPLDEVRRAVVADDGRSAAGAISTLFVGSRDAEPLVTALSAVGGEPVIVELRWDLPRTVAKLDLWFSPADVQAVTMLQNLAPVASELKSSVLILPHYPVVALPDTTPVDKVNRDCLFESRQFCIEGSSDIPGAEILKEATRQHCILEVRNSAWWDYISVLAEICPIPRVMTTDTVGTEMTLGNGSTGSYHGPSLECSRRAMQRCGIPEAAVERCANQFGAFFLEDDRVANTLDTGSPVALRINDWRYSGPMGNPSVLRALCRALREPPLVCTPYMLVPTATFEDSQLAAWAVACLCMVGAFIGTAAHRLVLAQLLPYLFHAFVPRCCQRAARRSPPKDSSSSSKEKRAFRCRSRCLCPCVRSQ
eukprot:gnl/TRDRNA2_/TRDRNA2_198455_c0_seq1.p1 gnl/TRDRNA2_/TRDRNA2_198455_c0~~gnl/TRDRNA2_/TRDRNA2_198455_c0_seq1.p1  ORF type:complete len:504 (-),score=47.46 gnl/TRDRNA2_/TRDRNA2_198455_c0_seq1:86-1525(-)